MRGSQRNKYLEAVENDVTTLEHIGFKHADGTIPSGDTALEEFADGLTLENVSAGLDLLTKANALLFASVFPKLAKHPLLRDPKTGKALPFVIDPNLAQEKFSLTEEQHKELDPRAYNLVKKAPMPEWMKKHLDIIMLCGMYLKYMGDAALNTAKAQVQLDLVKLKNVVAGMPKQKPPDSDYVPPQPTNGAAVEESFEPASSPEPTSFPDVPEQPGV